MTYQWIIKRSFFHLIYQLNRIVSPEVEFYLVKPNPDADYPLEVPIGQSGREETGKQAFGIDPGPLTLILEKNKESKITPVQSAIGEMSTPPSPYFV